MLDLIFRFDIWCALTGGLARDSLNGAIRVLSGFPASANVYQRVADVELNDPPTPTTEEFFRLLSTHDLRREGVEPQLCE